MRVLFCGFFWFETSGSQRCRWRGGCAKFGWEFTCDVARPSDSLFCENPVKCCNTHMSLRNGHQARNQIHFRSNRWSLHSTTTRCRPWFEVPPISTHANKFHTSASSEAGERMAAFIVVWPVLSYGLWTVDYSGRSVRMLKGCLVPRQVVHGFEWKLIL